MNMVAVLQWEPFMDEFGECFAFGAIKLSKGKLKNLPVDRCHRCHCPLKFVLQVLEVLLLCGCILKGGLQAADDDLPLYTEV